jgi:hypothetical protein
VPGGTGADFYWDGIFAAEYSPGVSAVAGMEEDVLMAAGMGWIAVGGRGLHSSTSLLNLSRFRH